MKQRLARESDVDITEPVRNILSSLERRPVHSEKPKDSSEDAAELIESLLSSIFPGLVLRSQPQPAPSTEKAQPNASDKGKGKARAEDVEKPQEPAPKPESAGEALADIIRQVMELSKSAPAPKSQNEAGPSGSSPLPSPPAKPAVTEREQAHIDRAIALSSIEHVQSALTKLQADFVLPAELDHYTPPHDDRDETASIASTSSSDLTKLIPYTSTNKPVYKYENELNGLLEELDRIDSHGDVEVREKRKEVVKAVEKVLEGIEHVVGGVVEKRLSSMSTTTPATDVPLKGFDVDEDVIEETTPAPEQVDTPVIIDEVSVPELATSVQVEETVGDPAEVSSPIDDILPASDAPVVSHATTDPPVDSMSTKADLEVSTATITPASVELIETEPTGSQVPVDAPETVDTFLLPENVSPPSPVRKPQEIDSDTDEVLALDSDAEKSDWSEVEH